MTNRSAEVVRGRLPLLVALLVGASGAGGCGKSSGPEPPTGTGGSAGSAEGGAAGEYIDATGHCRQGFEPGLFGCRSTYEAALAAENSCGVACAGPAGEQLLFLRDCTPTVRCAYDGTSHELVGAYFGDDVPSHCDGSYSVVAGAFPAEPVLNGYDQDLNCIPPGESSVSPLFDELFGANDLIQVGSSCRSTHDQCRGSIRAMVCRNDQGAVLGDGTCQHCQSDDDCRREYAYAQSATYCGPAGLCRFGTPLVGACSGLSDACFTAAAAFVCRDGLCARCETNAECTGSGPYNLCLDGVCLRSEPPP